MRKLYGRINESGGFERAPKTLDLDGYIILNPLEVHYRRAGYKPVRETEGAGLVTYTETEEEILQSWSGNTNSDGEDHITALEMAVCELYELIEGVLKNGENLL